MAEHNEEAWNKGLQIRREVLGDAYVDKALAGVRHLASCYAEMLTQHRDPIHLPNLVRNLQPRYVGLRGVDQGWSVNKDRCSTLAS